MVEIFALEEDPNPWIGFRESRRFGQQRRPVHVVGVEVVEFLYEGRVIDCGPEGVFDLLEGGHERFGHPTSTEFAEVGSFLLSEGTAVFLGCWGIHWSAHEMSFRKRKLPPGTRVDGSVKDS